LEASAPICALVPLFAVPPVDVPPGKVGVDPVPDGPEEEGKPRPPKEMELPLPARTRSAGGRALQHRRNERGVVVHPSARARGQRGMAPSGGAQNATQAVQSGPAARTSSSSRAARLQTAHGLPKQHLEDLHPRDPRGENVEHHLFHLALDRANRVLERGFECDRDLVLQVLRLRRDLRIRGPLDVFAAARYLLVRQALLSGVFLHLGDALRLLLLDLGDRAAIAVHPAHRPCAAYLCFALRGLLVVLQVLGVVLLLQLSALRCRGLLGRGNGVLRGLLRGDGRRGALVDAGSAKVSGIRFVDAVDLLLRGGVDALKAVQRGVHARVLNLLHAIRELLQQRQQLLVRLGLGCHIGVVRAAAGYQIAVAVVLVDLDIAVRIDARRAGETRSLGALHGQSGFILLLHSALAHVVEVLLIDLADTRGDLRRVARVGQLYPQLASVILHLAEVERLAGKPSLDARIIRFHDRQRGLIRQIDAGCCSILNGLEVGDPFSIGPSAGVRLVERCQLRIVLLHPCRDLGCARGPGDLYQITLTLNLLILRQGTDLGRVSHLCGDEGFAVQHLLLRGQPVLQLLSVVFVAQCVLTKRRRRSIRISARERSIVGCAERPLDPHRLVESLVRPRLRSGEVLQKAAATPVGASLFTFRFEEIDLLIRLPQQSYRGF
jgi:hypothetical protein